MHKKNYVNLKMRVFYSDDESPLCASVEHVTWNSGWNDGWDDSWANQMGGEG